jgi:hypothetical protein
MASEDKSGNGNVGVPGNTLRHAAGTEPPAQNMGWLDNVAGVIGGPNRADNVGVNSGPSSASWRAKAGKLTTGKQKR